MKLFYPNDLIKVTKEDGIKLNCTNNNTEKEKNITRKESMLYFKGADISTASITVITHDNSYKQPSLGFKGLDTIEKYEVDVLGKYHKVKIPEKRIGFTK